MLGTELCCPQNPCKTTRRLQGLSSWGHAPSWAKKPFFLLRVPSESPGSSKGDKLCGQLPHWEGKPQLWEASAAAGGSWLCPPCVTAVGSSSLPSDFVKHWWAGVPELWLPMPREPLKTLPWIPCAYWDTSTTPPHGKVGQSLGVLEWILFGLLQDFFKTKKSILHCKLTHFQSLTAQPPSFYRRAMCKHIYWPKNCQLMIQLNMITTFLTWSAHVVLKTSMF